MAAVVARACQPDGPVERSRPSRSPCPKRWSGLVPLRCGNTSGTGRGPRSAEIEVPSGAKSSGHPGLRMMPSLRYSLPAEYQNSNDIHMPSLPSLAAISCSGRPYGDQLRPEQLVSYTLSHTQSEDTAGRNQASPACLVASQIGQTATKEIRISSVLGDAHSALDSSWLYPWHSQLNRHQSSSNATLPPT
jgi:hypothetical protein